jgi:Tfp pilus assembly protein PilP
MRAITIFILILSAMLFGCDYLVPKIDLDASKKGKEVKPIEVDTNSILKQKKELEDLFEAKYEPLTYENKKNPFVSVVDIYKTNLMLASTGGANPLLNMELDQMKFTGSLIGEVGTVAVVEAGGQIFYVKEGDKIGKNSGIIVSITPDVIKIRQSETDIFGNINTVIREIMLTSKEERP